MQLLTFFFCLLAASRTINFIQAPRPLRHEEEFSYITLSKQERNLGWEGRGRHLPCCFLACEPDHQLTQDDV